MTEHTRIVPAPLAGAGIGVLNALSMGTAGEPLGVTSAFEDVTAMALRRLAPAASGINRYLAAREKTPKLDWEAALVAGIWLGSRLLGRETVDEVPATWARRFGPGRWRRRAGAFAGGAVMMFGARMARGCTSGHGISGAMQLAVSSWVFTPLMFATAALTARALFGREKR